MLRCIDHRSRLVAAPMGLRGMFGVGLFLTLLTTGVFQDCYAMGQSSDRSHKAVAAELYAKAEAERSKFCTAATRRFWNPLNAAALHDTLVACGKAHNQLFSAWQDAGSDDQRLRQGALKYLARAYERYASLIQEEDAGTSSQR